MIERKVANALALDYPAELLRIVVASDGSSDRTVELARAAGADLVLDLPRGGKVAALNEAVRQTQAPVVAFSDANSFWHADALRRLVARLRQEGVGYVCGQVRFSGGEGGNQEGLYWRYEMAVRGMESGLAGITAGNGGIYAVRREAYVELDPSRGQDIGFPFEITKHGWRAVYEPTAVAEERMAPDRRGRVQAQAPDDVGAVGRDAAVGDAEPARLQPRLRVRDLLPPPRSLPDAVAAPGGSADQLRAARARGDLRRHNGAAARLCWRRPRWAASSPSSPSASPTTT